MTEISIPRRIFYDEPVESVLQQLINILNIKKMVIVTDKVIRGMDFFRKITDAVSSTSYQVFDDVEPEPPIDIGDKVAKVIKQVGADVVIAVGGGSVIDSAKAGVVKSLRPDLDVEDIAPFNPIGMEFRRPIIIAIPTTSGTGSDASYAMVLTKDENKRKIKIDVANSELVPYIVILDPKIPAGMPKTLTIGTALDAMTHAIESFVSTNSNPFTDALSLKVVEGVLRYLPIVLKDPSNLEARANLHIAATMAGMAFSNSGLGLAHALGHPLGAMLGLHHGTAVGLLLPYVIDFNYNDSRAKEKYDYIKDFLELTLKLEKKEKLSEHIRLFYSKIDFPQRLRGMEIEKNKFDKVKKFVAEEALHDPTLAFNPRIPTPEELESLLESIY